MTYFYLDKKLPLLHSQGDNVKTLEQKKEMWSNNRHDINNYLLL